MHSSNPRIEWARLAAAFVCCFALLTLALPVSAQDESKDDAKAETKVEAQDDAKPETNVESPADPQVEPQVETFADLMTKWAELDAELKAKEASLDAADEIANQEFAELVSLANTHLNKIKANVMLAIENKSADKEMMRAILGIMIDDATHRRDQEVQRVGDRLVAFQIDPRYFEAVSKAERLRLPGRELFEELTIRAREAKADDLPRVKLTTSKGEIVFELFENEAPNTVANFINLTKQKFYDGIKFHRVIEGFVAQTGCPQGNGEGGPGYTIKCECGSPAARGHFYGSLSMAHAGTDTGGSQFFITFDRTSDLNGRHTVFGRVVSGEDVLAKLARNVMLINGNEVPIPDVVADTIIKAEILRDRGHEYVLQKVDDAPVEKTPVGDAPTETNKDSDGKDDDDKADDKAGDQ